MKRMIIPITLFLLMGSVSAFAQGGFQRRTVEERVQMIHQKMDSAFKLDKDKLANVDSLYANYYRTTDKMREDLMAGGGQPDQASIQAMREKMQPLSEERDKKLQAILTADQYKTWKEVIEPSMRPRGMRGGNGR